MREWAFNYIVWKPNKLILFGCYKDYDYCEPDVQQCIRTVDMAITRMINMRDGEAARLKDELYHSIRHSIQKHKPFEYHRLTDIIRRLENIQNDKQNKKPR